MRLCPDRFVDIYEVPGCQINSQWGQQELLQRSLSHELAAYFSDLYLYCDLMKRSHYQKYVKLHKSVKLSFTNIRGLRSNFVGCESFLESNPPDILALYESKVEDSVDSNKLSVRGVVRKGSVSHMHGLAVYTKNGVPFARNFSLETSQDLYLCFRLALLITVPYLHSLYWSLPSSLCALFSMSFLLTYSDQRIC